MDPDVLVSRNPLDVFKKQFDVGLTYHREPKVVLDRRGLPLNTQASPINGGVIFCRPTAGAEAFFAEHVRMYDRLDAEGDIPLRFVPNIRLWGGDQYVLMALVGLALFSTPGRVLHCCGAKVRFFPCSTYNFTPKPCINLTREGLSCKYLIHLKGRLKGEMPRWAEWMGLT